MHSGATTLPLVAVWSGDMNAIRRNEQPDNLHSIYVTTGSVTQDERNTDTLGDAVYVCGTLDELAALSPAQHSA